MEREVQEVLGPLGIDQAVSRRVSGALLKVESEYCPPSPSHSGSEESFMKGLVRKLARSSKGGDVEADRLKLGSTDVGMTAFLLKFGEGLEDVPTSRLWVSDAMLLYHRSLCCELLADQRHNHRRRLRHRRHNPYHPVLLHSESSNGSFLVNWRYSDCPDSLWLLQDLLLWRQDRSQGLHKERFVYFGQSL